MAYYFIKGSILGRPRDSSEFTEVFQGGDNAKLAYDNFLANKKTKGNKTPKGIDVEVFNKVG